MSEQPLKPMEMNLKTLEEALRGLDPVVPELDRDQLFFEAGRASVPPSSARPSRYWPLATLFATGIAVAFAGVLLRGPRVVVQTVEIERIVECPVPIPPTPSPNPPLVGRERPETPEMPEMPEANLLTSAPLVSPYFRLQDQLLCWGLDGMGAPPPLLPPAELVGN